MLVLKAVCSECATINDNDAKFCKHCGVGNTKKIDKPNPFVADKPGRCPSCDRFMFSKTCFFCQPTAVYA